MRRVLLPTLLLLAMAAPLRSALALPAPHSDASGVVCGDCHQLHAGAAATGQNSVATSPGTTTSLIDGSQRWQLDWWVGGFVTFTSGPNDGQVREVIANTSSTMSWSQPLPSGVAVSDTYSLARDADQDMRILCQGCHNPTGAASSMPNVALHVTSDGTTIGCGKCHDAHNVAPNSGVGQALIRNQIRWPTANNPVTFPAPGNPQIAGATSYNGVCETCHTQANNHRNDASGNHAHHATELCTDCHSHESGFSTFDHDAQGAVTAVTACMNCHGVAGPSTVSDVHGAQCGLCHVDPAGGGALVPPHEIAHPGGGSCSTCHGTQTAAHAGANHNASPPPGDVTIFDDYWHDDAGWNPPSPFFSVRVDCVTCHNLELTAAHGNDCMKCHFTTVNALGTWGGGCSQGGCHPTFHADSWWVHWPWEDYRVPPGNNCNLCHGAGFNVTQDKCLNCHTGYSAGDTTPPVTTSDALASYTGPATITFSMTDSGKVGIGTTYRRLNGGVVRTGIGMEVSTPGAHTLEFWSVDQVGNVESPPKVATFTITADTTPPVTTSNAQASYWQGGTITLSATDNSNEGVKTTYWRMDGGTIRTGRTVGVPNLAGTIAHTLEFWSEDFSGNVETPPKVANFSNTGGNATLRLIWGNSEATGIPPEPGAWADWTIRRGGYSGPVVASGSGAYPGWDGVDDEVVPVWYTPYYVRIVWWDTRYDWDDETVFGSVPVVTPGEIIRLNY